MSQNDLILSQSATVSFVRRIGFPLRLTRSMVRLACVIYILSHMSPFPFSTFIYSFPSFPFPAPVGRYTSLILIFFAHLPYLFSSTFPLYASLIFTNSIPSPSNLPCFQFFCFRSPFQTYLFYIHPHLSVFAVTIFCPHPLIRCPMSSP